jgi:hypothetical protein
METRTILQLIAGLLFWPSMLWLGYHFDWTLPAAIVVVLYSVELNKKAREM